MLAHREHPQASQPSLTSKSRLRRLPANEYVLERMDLGFSTFAKKADCRFALTNPVLLAHAPPHQNPPQWRYLTAIEARHARR